MGGKEDDTTLLLALVSLIPHGEKAFENLFEKDELWRLHIETPLRNGNIPITDPITDMGVTHTSVLSKF